MTCIYCDKAISDTHKYIAGDPIHDSCYKDLGDQLDLAFDRDHCGSDI